MRNYFLLLLLLPVIALSQNSEDAEKKVDEGINLHDQGKFNEALTKYEEALILDKNNLYALTEKAMTLNASKKFEEAVSICKDAFQYHPDKNLKNVYVTYANSLDHLKKVDEAIKIYDEGLKKYPSYYQLHFNKGITLANAKKTNEAIISFQNALQSNPNHSGSYNAIAILEQENRIVTILASSRYLTLDNKSARARANLDLILKLMEKGVSQKEDKTVTINIDSNLLENVNNKKGNENDFNSTDLILSMATAQDFHDNKDKTACQKFIHKFKSICSSMSELKKGQKGFYWQFLAPYFIEMENKKLIEPFANIIFLSNQSPDVLKYHEENSQKIQEFYDWSKNYKWVLNTL